MVVTAHLISPAFELGVQESIIPSSLLATAKIYKENKKGTSYRHI